MSSDADVLAEIARLTSAIDQHKRYTAPPTRGRGRGRSTPIHRNATWVAPHLFQPSGSRSGTTTPIEHPLPQTQAYKNQNSLGGKKEEQEKPKPIEREVEIGGVTFVADSRGNKLVRRKSVPINPATPSISTSLSAPKQEEEANTTPRRTSHLGTTYIRTKSGNLVSLAFARDRKQKVDALKEGSKKVAGESPRGGRGRGRGRGRGAFSRSARSARSTRTKPSKPKSDKLCIFFQKTGQCSRAQTCPYIHDSTKIAMCPLFLRSNCPRTSSTCPLSHSPNPHRSPHCSHFPHCTRASCPYAHVVVSGDAKVCREFVEYGWCTKGKECEKRHVRECWRFSETGKCEVKGCKEPHVLRRIHQDEEESEGEESEQEEIEADAEEEMEREEKGIKRKRDSIEGISGEAGRKRSSKNKKRKATTGAGGGMQDQSDFVELFIPSSSDREEEEDQELEGSDQDSVDSDDLAEDDEEEEKSLSKSNPPIASTSDISQPIATRTQHQVTEPKISSPMKPKPQFQPRPKPRKHYDDVKQESEPLELDYGLSSSEDEGPQEGDETVYLDADEGEDDEDEETEDADVVNLLRR